MEREGGADWQQGVRRAERAILLADVSGSTRLYAELGDEEAHRRISACVERMASLVRQNGGEVVHSKGDDLLSTFGDPLRALAGARAVMAGGTDQGVQVHVGLHWGLLLEAEGDVFGDAVNVTARLAARANAGETLVSGVLARRVPGIARANLRALGPMALRGRDEPLEVFAVATHDHAIMTQALPLERPGPAGAASVTVRAAGAVLELGEGGELLVGRSDRCALVFERPWVSRVHAAVAVREGLVELTDRSSTGSYVRMNDEPEFFLRRRSVILSGSGQVSLGLSLDSSLAEPFEFQTTRTRHR